MFKKVLIANRGEIAVRVMRTLREMGIASVAIYSDADADALHVQYADEAVHVGPAASAESYLRIDRVLEACRQTGAEAVHPGYGFLSENTDFAKACEDAGIVFIGPPASAILAMGEKTQARRLMIEAGVPVVPGAEYAIPTAAEAKVLALEMGFPVLVKAAAGGGGKGMRRVDDPDEFERAFAGAQREALAAFGNGDVTSRSGSCSRSTSRSRCSRTNTATRCTSSSATAACSVGTRRWWRSRPARSSALMCERRWARWP